MSVDLKSIKALTFDVGGTIFDWHHTIRDEVQRLSNSRGVQLDAAQFTNDWRFGMAGVLTKVKSGQLPWMNADEMHRIALEEVLRGHSALEMSVVERDELNRVWHRLRVWPDAPKAIENLRGRYTVVVFTVLSWSIAVDSSKAAGISWDGILSCEFLGHYKTDPEAYQAAVRLLGIEPSQAMMVEAHPGDLKGAKAAGLRTAYVRRLGEKGEGNDPDFSTIPEFDVHAADFDDLTMQLLA
jgi:2-haloacid dehalogenase